MFLRQRQKVQKMSRGQRVVLALLALSLRAEILPEGMENHARKTPVRLVPEPAAVWRDYGLQEAEKADYSGPKGTFSVSAWRVADATAAQAAFQLLRPANAKPADAGKLGARWGNALLVAMGNYVLLFEGFTPEEETLNQLVLHMPRFDHSSLPSLTGFVPAGGRIGNSERYVLGPASLEAFAPGIAPSLAGFHFGTEGQFARYQGPSGEIPFLLLNYPTPQIAKDREAAFREQRPDLIVKRAGPMLGIVLKAPNADEAERLLAQLRWEANITVNQQMPDPKGDNIGVLVVNVGKFSVLLILFAVLAGGAFAVFRRVSGKISGTKAGEGAEVIGLNLDGH